MDWAEHFTQLRRGPRPLWPALALPSPRPEKLWALFVCDPPRDGGELLEKMLAAMRLPPGRGGILFTDQSPLAEKMAALSPRVVIAAGVGSANLLLGRREESLSRIRGRFHPCSYGGVDFQLIPVFHPDILRINPDMKRTAWLDLQRVMAFLDNKIC